LIGFHGVMKPLHKHASLGDPFFYLWDIPHAIGAMLWRMKVLKIPLLLA
jgi:hypothetical protein